MQFFRAPLRAMSSAATSSLVTTSKRGAVGLITLNRPQALNALNSALIAELNEAARAFDADASVGAIVLTVGQIGRAEFASL